MGESYSITFRKMSAYNNLELIRSLITEAGTLDFNGMMSYIDFLPGLEKRDPYYQEYISEKYDSGKFLDIAQIRYEHQESISFAALIQGLHQPLFFTFSPDGSIEVSFTYLDVPFSEKYKLADLNLVLSCLFKFFGDHHCDIWGYTIEWGD